MPRKKRRRPHGQGSVYKRGPGCFTIAWWDGSQRRTKGGFATRDFAERALARIVNEVRAGEVGLAPDPRSQPRLEELADRWLERRMHTHRAAKDDGSRWRKHLKPFFGRMRPGEVDASNIRKFIEQKLLEGLSPGTVGLCIRLLSTFFSDIVEQRFVGVNPVSTLPRSTRRLYRVALDPRGVPFLERSEDIRRVFLNMPEPCRVAFAVGALAGLRTGEILGLEWQDVDLEARRLHVRQQVQDGRLGPVKDDDARVVPILKSLSPILSEWRLATGGAGLLFKPPHPTRGGRPGRPAAFIRQHTLRRHLLDALRTCELEEMTWYQATRHSFASHWVLSGGSIEKLSAVLGHSSVTTTQRYAHLRPDLFMESDFDRVQVDLARPRGDVVSVCPQPEDGAVSYAAATRASGPAH